MLSLGSAAVRLIRTGAVSADPAGFCFPTGSSTPCFFLREEGNPQQKKPANILSFISYAKQNVPSFYYL